MAQIQMGGAGLNLPTAAQLYPTYPTISSIGYQPATNQFTLAPGQTQVFPAGQWAVYKGLYSSVEFYDPVSTTWRQVSANRDQTTFLQSDGVNFRIRNPLGCPVGAVVTNVGSGTYTQSGTTVTASSGNSGWTAIIGGRMNPTVTITTAGAGYVLPPQVFIPAPPSPGLPASGYATISSNSVSSIILTHWGAGYVSTPSIYLLPNLNDPNYQSGNITTTAVANGALAGSGLVMAVVCTNSGTPVAYSAGPTLTITGAGSSAAASVSLCQTVTGITTVTTSGNGYGTWNNLQFQGGINAATTVVANPLFELGIMVPRQPQAYFTLSTGAVQQTLTIIDGGQFINAPTFGIATSGLITTVATFTITTGSVADTIVMQPI